MNKEKTNQVLRRQSLVSPSCAGEAAQCRVPKKKTQNGFQRDRHRRLSLPDCRAYWRTTKRGCTGVWCGGERGRWRRRKRSVKCEWKGNTRVFLSPVEFGRASRDGFIMLSSFSYLRWNCFTSAVLWMPNATRGMFVVEDAKERGGTRGNRIK